MARLVTTIIEAGMTWFPVAEHIMVDPKDVSKPGRFLQLFPQPLSRLYLTILWKINREQDGDGVLLTNVWLRNFSKLDKTSLVKYRAYLHDEHIISAKRIGTGGREYLYRLLDPRTAQPLNAETDVDAIARMRNPTRIGEIARDAARRRFSKATPEPPDAPLSLYSEMPLPASTAADMEDSWGSYV
jgi:hypothetical protein